MPAMTFSSVLFPAPLWPMRPTRSPAWIETDTDCSAFTVRGTLRRRRPKRWASTEFSVSCRSAPTWNSRSTCSRRMRATVLQGEDDAALEHGDDCRRTDAEDHEDQAGGHITLIGGRRAGQQRMTHDL